MKYLFSLVLPVLLLAACGGTSPSPPSTSPTATSPAPAQPKSSVQDPLGTYRLAPGDRLNILVFGQQDLSGEFEVDGAGNLSLPLLGLISAQGLTLREFQADLQKRLEKDFLVNPRVNIDVINYRPFFILGQVNKPGRYNYLAGLDARQAVALAGGFTRRARTSSVRLIRKVDGERRETWVDLDTPVFPGDTIEVERRLF